MAEYEKKELHSNEVLSYNNLEKAVDEGQVQIAAQ